MEIIIEGNIFLQGRLQKAALGIEGGVIAQIRKVMKGDRVLDFGDRLVMPGAVDAHVHFREPGLAHKEGFLTGTTAAACGGVTTALDMPNTIPPTVTLTDLREKASLARRTACVDVGLFAGLVPGGDPERVSGAAVGYKLYMGSTTGNLLVKDYSALPAILGRARATLRPLAVHAEDEGMISSIAAQPADLISYSEARPPACEASAIAKFASALGEGRGHVCHVSSRAGLEALGGLGCEATPHHLLLDAVHNSRLGTLGKVNPPIRKREDREALWEAFAGGRVEVLASDHAPHLEEEKDAPFGEAPAGVPGTETMLPLMMMMVKQGRLELGRLAQAACANPARIFGLDAGELAVGMPAHIAVYDLRRTSVIRGKRLNSKCAWSPFEGMEAVFPRAVFLRGARIVEDGEPTVSPGSGVLVTGRVTNFDGKPEA